jgi:hypothetical protein
MSQDGGANESASAGQQYFHGAQHPWLFAGVGYHQFSRCSNR